MRKCSTAFLLILVVAAPLFSANAREPAPAPVAGLTDPIWRSKPADDDLWKYYPLRAYHAGVNGVAVVSCLVSPTGWLVNCGVYGEDPKREGFGTALAKLASRMQVDSVSASGTPTKGRVIKIGAQFKYAPMAEKARAPYTPWGNNFAYLASHSTSIELVTVQQ